MQPLEPPANISLKIWERRQSVRPWPQPWGPLHQNTWLRRNNSVKCYHHCQTHLEQLFHYHLEAHYQRAVTDGANRCQPVRTTPARAIDREALPAYTVDNPFVPRPPRREHFAAAAFGATLTKQVYQWMLCVHWPLDDNLHPLQSLGVTWIEFALSFVLTTSCWIPVKRTDERGDEALLVPRSLQDVRANSVKLSEISQAFANMIKQVVELTDAVPWPDQPKGLVRSLYVLGASVFNQGFLHRPAFPAQARVQALLEPYLRLHRGPAFEQMPEVNVTVPAALWQTIHDETRGVWPHRCEAARAAWRKFSKWKRQMAGQQRLHFGWRFAASFSHLPYAPPVGRAWRLWIREKGSL